MRESSFEIVGERRGNGKAPDTWRPQRLLKIALGLALLAVAALPLFGFPVLGTWLLLPCAVYLCMLLLLPRLWLLVLPVAAVLVDFTPWTGRASYNEFDLLFLLTIASGLLYNRIRLKVFAPGPALTLLGIFLAVLALGYSGWWLVPLAPQEVWQSPYYTSAYAYQLSKGVVWGIALVPMWGHQLAVDKQRAVDALVSGTALAAVCLGLVVLWERGILDGMWSLLRWQHDADRLLSLNSPYRVTALFADAHTGTQALNGMLLLLMPATLYAIAYGSNVALRLLGVAGFLAVGYAALLGFSLLTYAAFCLGAVLYLSLLLWYRRRSGLHLSDTPKENPRWQRLLLFGVCLALPVFVAFAIGSKQVNQQFARLGPDLTARLQHWQAVVESSPGGIWRQLAGNGVGTFPLRYRQAHPENRLQTGSYGVSRDEEFKVLRLTGAPGFSVAQRVRIQPNSRYGVYLRLRAREAATLTVALCERNISYAGDYKPRCVSQQVSVPADYARFREISLEMHSGPVGQGHGLTRWPTVFALRSEPAGATVEIDKIELSADRDNLLRNSAFSAGLDNWLAYNDQAHQSWHVGNLFLRLWFEMGWLGLGLFLLLLLLLARSLSGPRAVDSLQPVYVTAVAAVCLLGLGASPLEATRTSGLFWFLLVAGLAQLQLSKKPGRVRREPESARYSRR